MQNLIREHWKHISTGILLASLLGLGAFKVHAYMTGDCCEPGAACCYPGSPCCAHGAGKVATR